MNDLSMQIGERMYLRRKELGLTQKQAARLLKISAAYYGQIERGTRGISVERLLEICEKMDLDPTYLMTGRRTGELDKIIRDCPEEKGATLEKLLKCIAELTKSSMEPEQERGKRSNAEHDMDR